MKKKIQLNYGGEAQRRADAAHIQFIIHLTIHLYSIHLMFTLILLLLFIHIKSGHNWFIKIDGGFQLIWLPSLRSRLLLVASISFQTLRLLTSKR